MSPARAASWAHATDVHRYCMYHPWLTTSDWPVSALEGKAAKNTPDA
jgi:hypothetical protein